MSTMANSQKHCLKCDSALADEAKFCSNCGANIEESGYKVLPIPATQQTAGSAVAPSSKTAGGISSNNNVILISVAFMAMLVALMYYHSGFVQPLMNKQQPQPVAQQPQQNQAPENTTAVQAPAPPPEIVRTAVENADKTPGSAELNTKAGNLLFDSGRYSEAIPYYQKSLNVEPNNPNVIVDMGVCYFNLKDFSKAQDQFKLALSINKNHLEALYNMGVVSVEMGNVDQLIHYWSQLREVAPNSPQAQNAQRILQQIHDNHQQQSTGQKTES